MRTLIRKGLGRRLLLEDPAAGPTHPPGAPRAIKLFEASGILGGARARRRARREHRILVELADRGLPVPRPLGLSRCMAPERGWEVAMQWLPDSTALEEILESRAAWPCEPGRAAAMLGRALAGLHAAGVDHPDLHPGNALLNRTGGAWLVDFHRARLRSRPHRAILLRDLVSIAASTRERLPARVRARFLLAWARALPPELRPGLGGLAELSLRVEEAARLHRLGVVRHRERRWLREGPACRGARLPGGRSFERADLEPGWALRLMDGMERGRTRAATGRQVPDPDRGDRRVLLLEPDSPAAARGAWLTSSRLLEHRIPAARPLAVYLGSPPWTALELPPDAAPLGERPLPAAGRERCRLAGELGRLMGKLHDRGLDLGPGARLFLDDEGRAFLGALPGLLSLTPERRGPGWDRLLGALGEADGNERMVYRAAYLDAHRGHRREVPRLTGELRSG